MKPSEFIERLQSIAQDSRHHPEPAVAVSLLAQLLLDLTIELEPLAQKFGLLLQASGFPGGTGEMLAHIEAEIAAAQEAAGLAAESVALDAGTVEALAALVDPALAGAPEFTAETSAA